MAGSKKDGTKRLVLVVSNKGGVGKSVVSRALLDTLRSTGRTVHAFDADGDVGSLLTAYGTRENGKLVPNQDPAVGVGYYDIRKDGSRNAIIDGLASGAPVVLHDLAGGSLGELKRVADDGDGVEQLCMSIEEQGYKLVLVHVLSNVQGATASVAEYVQAFGEHAEHVAVLNKAWGREDQDFPFWFGFTRPDGSTVGGKTRDALLKAGGSEISFPALQPGTFAKAEASNLRYREAANDESLTLTERAHLSRFTRAANAAFLEAADKFGL